MSICLHPAPEFEEGLHRILELEAELEQMDAENQGADATPEPVYTFPAVPITGRSGIRVAPTPPDDENPPGPMPNIEVSSNRSRQSSLFNAYNKLEPA